MSFQERRDWLTVRYIPLLVIHLIGIFGGMSRVCAIDSAVAFLTVNHVVQIGFDKISPSAGTSASSGNEIRFQLLAVCLRATSSGAYGSFDQQWR